MEPFLQQSLEILKVTSHYVYKMLLHVSNVDLVCHLASPLVNDNWNSAYASVLTLVGSSASSAFAVSHLEVH